MNSLPHYYDLLAGWTMHCSKYLHTMLPICQVALRNFQLHGPTGSRICTCSSSLNSTPLSTLINASPATEKSLIMWEEEARSFRASRQAKNNFIIQVTNRAWYFAGARISNIVSRTVIEELERYNYISSTAHETALNIITAIESITHVTLTTISVSGAMESKQQSLERMLASSSSRGLLPWYQILLICPIGIFAFTARTPIEIALTIALSLVANYIIGWLETRRQRPSS